jgi:hypothetical protein
MISINKRLVIVITFLIIFIICSISYQPIIADKSIISVPQKINEYNTIKILFIGSSYFNFNNLPSLFENQTFPLNHIYNKFFGYMFL